MIKRVQTEQNEKTTWSKTHQDRLETDKRISYQKGIEVNETTENLVYNTGPGLWSEVAMDIAKMILSHTQPYLSISNLALLGPNLSPDVKSL